MLCVAASEPRAVIGGVTMKRLPGATPAMVWFAADENQTLSVSKNEYPFKEISAGISQGAIAAGGVSLAWLTIEGTGTNCIIRPSANGTVLQFWLTKLVSSTSSISLCYQVSYRGLGHYRRAFADSAYSGIMFNLLSSAQFIETKFPVKILKKAPLP